MRFPSSKTAVAYWAATALLCLFMARSAYEYLTNPLVVAECHRLGFPDWLRVELAVAKLLGVLALLLPVGGRIKEWAGAGFAILLVSAALAHVESGEPLRSITGPLVLLGLLAVSVGLRGRALGQGGTEKNVMPSVAEASRVGD